MVRERPATTARELALRVLDAALLDHEPAEARFAREAGASALAARDRAFARLLYTTALRHKIAIDQALAGRLERPPRQRSAMNLLRLGTAQLIYLRTAPHAAVGESVELAKMRRLAPPGLVNAVLRKLVDADPPILPPLATLPEWLARRWAIAYGGDLAAAIAAALARPPPLDLTIKDDLVGWADRLAGKRLEPATLRLAEAGPVEALPGYSQGAWWVQDYAATLPARLLRVAPGERVLDLCAAPGGKTAQLAAAGALVTSVERDARRAERLVNNLERLGLAARLVVADLLDYRPDEPFPAVLLDAPCTATGTFRRHPDILWSKSAADVLTMAALQQRLLAKAAEFVAPGGRLVYAVCSLEPEEGPDIVRRFLAARPDFARLPIAETETGFAPTPAGDLRTHPAMLAEIGGMDGFFIARLVRHA